MALVGFNFPFIIKNREVLPPQAELRLIKNDLKQLLLTSPKERRMRTSFGTQIRKFPFELIYAENISGLKDSIREAIVLYEPRVKFRDVKITGDPDNHFLAITVLCALSRDPNIILSVDISTVNPQAIVPSQQQVL